MYFCQGQGESRNTRESRELLQEAEHNTLSTMHEAERGDMLGGQGRVQTPQNIPGVGLGPETLDVFQSPAAWVRTSGLGKNVTSQALWSPCELEGCTSFFASR